MNFIGGRFTSFIKDDIPIPTGAVHMIPHRFGPMKRTLIDRLNLPIDLIDSGRPAIIDENGTQLELGGKEAVKLFLKSLFKSFRSSKIMDSIFEFSIGLKSSSIPLSHRIAFMKRIREFSHHVTPRGGVKTIIDALSEMIRSYENTISINQEVIRIIRQSDGSFNLHTEKEQWNSDIVIANCRPELLPTLLGNQTGQLGSGFIKHARNNIPGPGIKIVLVCNHQVCPRSITFTPFLNAISGFSEPTIADPKLAGGKHHLILSHQQLFAGSVEEQINAALSDIRDFIPDFKDSCRIIATQVFQGVYPVNRAPQGHDFSCLTQIPNLYLVGDGVKPKGYIMTEGVARSVELVTEQILGGTIT